MLLPQLVFVLVSIAALVPAAQCDSGRYVALNLRLESVRAAQADVVIVTSHINTPTSPDPRHESESLSLISRRVDSAFRKNDVELLEHMLRQTPEYAPSLPAVIVAVNEASEVTLEFTVVLSLGEVTDKLSCLRDALSHSAASGFCASALPAHAHVVSCIPTSQAASQNQLGAVFSQVDCSLRQ